MNVRSSNSFGPFFMERSLTGGRRQVSFGVAYNDATFDNIDGRELRDGTLVATAGRLVGDARAVRRRDADASNPHTCRHGVGTRRRDGPHRRQRSRPAPERQPRRTTRGHLSRGGYRAGDSAWRSASGIGDVRLGAKYNAIRRGGSGIALAGEARLPTGDSDNLLGSGELVFIASADRIARTRQIRRARRTSDMSSGGLRTRSTIPAPSPSSPTTV